MRAIADNQRFPIGTTYTKYVGSGKAKHVREYTVRDVLRTYNSAGELVNLRYVVSHSFCGQDVFDYDVPDTTIARALFEPIS